jgi:hypothetical protein
LALSSGRPPLRLQILAYPVIDGRQEYPSHAENAEGYLLTTDAMRWFWGHYAPGPADRADPYASPIAAPDLHGLAPALVAARGPTGTAKGDNRPFEHKGHPFSRYPARIRYRSANGFAPRYNREKGREHGCSHRSATR